MRCRRFKSCRGHCRGHCWERGATTAKRAKSAAQRGQSAQGGGQRPAGRHPNGETGRGERGALEEADLRSPCTWGCVRLNRAVRRHDGDILEDRHTAAVARVGHADGSRGARRSAVCTVGYAVVHIEGTCSIRCDSPPGRPRNVGHPQPTVGTCEIHNCRPVHRGGSGASARWNPRQDDGRRCRSTDRCRGVGRRGCHPNGCCSRFDNCR